MPLRAVLNEETLVSFKVPTGQWDELKNSDERKDLTLPCCSGRAVVKTSQLGTQFFAHYRKTPDCISEPESKEHLRLKSIVAAAAEVAGWEVTTEYLGESKDGEKWIADVYCTKGKAKVALEIQLSQQTASELEHRQQRYKESGVRGAWFMAPRVYQNAGHRSKKDFPRFSLKGYEKDDQAPLVEDYDLTLVHFVKHLLNGDFEWYEDIDTTFIYYMKSNCWKCRKHLRVPIGLGYSLNSNYNDFIKTVPNCSTFYEGFLKNPGNGNLEQHDLTVIGPKPYLKGNAPDFPFCTKCNRCYAPQSNYHTFENFKAWCSKNDREKHYVVHTRYHNNGRYRLKGTEEKKVWKNW